MSTKFALRHTSNRQTSSVTSKNLKIRSLNFSIGMFSWRHSLRLRRCYDTRNYTRIKSSFVPFENFVKLRRDQAKRSVLVQVNSELSFPELHSYCSQFGSIIGVHHYTLRDNQQHFMLLEFNNEEETSNLLSSSCFSGDNDTIPVQSSCLWFRTPCNNINKAKNVANNNSNMGLTTKFGCDVPAENVILNELSDAGNVADQINCLWKMTHLNDLGIRLRFLVAKQVEGIFSSMCPSASVYPFGSSVNGFGKMGCDLDLVIKLSPEFIKNDQNSRLVFHTKKSLMNGRLQQQRYIEILGDMIQLFLPGCSQVRRISLARIPIIKYNQDYMGIECDLSMGSLSGFYMSELLYLFGSLDDRVRPLVFTIRKWADETGLTNVNPGKWISNFSLTLLVIFFLQNAPNGPILPTLNFLKEHAGEKDARITDDLVNCTFARNIENIPFETTNTTDLNQLLLQFFEYYAKFEFSLDAVSINEGKSLNKSDHSALYIINPLETILNVSKNVSFEECARFAQECRNALWLVDSSMKDGAHSTWNIGTLFNNPLSKAKFLSSKRLVSVKDLFSNEVSHMTMDVTDNDGDVSIKKTKNEIVNTNKQQKIIFKNHSIKAEVEKIKNENTVKQKQLELNTFKATHRSEWR